MPFDFAAGSDNWHDLLSSEIATWRRWLKDNPGQHATIDFETRSACDLKTYGSWIYSKHPSTEAMVLSFKLPGYEEPDRWYPSYNEFDDDEFLPGTDLPLDLFAYILAGGLVEAHNAFFERVIWLNVMVARHGWPAMPSRQWRCSASRASACALPRDLENACKAMGLDIEKDMEGRRLMLRMSKPRKPRKAELEEWIAQGHKAEDMPILWDEPKEKLLRLFDYCDQDVRAEEALSNVLPALSDRELEVWFLDQEFNERGVRFDLAMADAALKIAQKARKRLNTELFQITGVDKATQRQRVKDWLKESEDLDLPDTAAETLDKYIDGPLMDQCSDRARRVLEIVRDVNRTSTRKYQTAINKTDPDDWRARDLLMYWGANTGRWSGKGIQVQNFPRGLSKNVAKLGKTGYYLAFDMDVAAEDILDLDEEWIAATYEGGVMEALSTALRGMITPAEGHDLISADYSAIEARCVLWEADDQDALQVFRTGGDIYCDMATGIYGFDVNKKDHPNERQFGKQAILGLGYGMGFITFLITCRKYKITFTKEQVLAILGEERYAKYDEWLTDYLWPTVKEGQTPASVRSKKAQASKNIRRLKDADIDAAACKHELILMKYTVDVYRRRYAAVKQMWDDQEAAAIQAVQRWQDMVTEETAEWQAIWGDDSSLPISDRDAITGPTIEAGKIKWYVMGGFLCCELPSGRLLRYRDPEVKPTKTSWGAVKPGLRYWTVVQPGNKWARTSTYGGKIVENITQAVARDIMADAMIRSAGSSYFVIMTVHDEMVAEVPQNEGSLQEFEELMSQIEPWAEGCPVTAEAERYARYRK